MAVATVDKPVMLPFAHASHWLANLIMLAPILGVGFWLAVVGIRDRRQRSQ
jgi:hypothetical protein